MRNIPYTACIISLLLIKRVKNNRFLQLHFTVRFLFTICKGVTAANWPSTTSLVPVAPLCLLHVLQLPFTTATGAGIFQLFSSNSSSVPSDPIYPIIPWSPSHPFSLPSLHFCITYLPRSHASSAPVSPILDFPCLSSYLLHFPFVSEHIVCTVCKHW